MTFSLQSGVRRFVVGGLGVSGLAHPHPTAEWEFPKIRGTSFWGPYNKDPTI